MGDEHDLGAAPPKKGLSTCAIVAIAGALGVVALCGVGIMATLLMPALLKAKLKANQTKCANNLRQIGLAGIQHADDTRYFPHDPSDPTGQAAMQALVAAGYLDVGVLSCPNAPGVANAYEGFVLAQLPATAPGTQPIAWDAQPHPDGRRNVLYADGTVSVEDEASFTAVLQRARAHPGR